MSETSAQRDENRFTESDRETMTRAVILGMDGWTGPREIGADSVALQRIAAHSIGCSLDDLRDSEKLEIDQLVRWALNQ